MFTNFGDKKDTAELIILNDVNFMGKQEEMIKDLIVEQNANIESKFIDDKVWDVSLPCIIFTNKISAFHYFCNSPKYKNDTI